MKPANCLNLSGSNDCDKLSKCHYLELYSPRAAPGDENGEPPMLVSHTGKN